MKKKIPWFTIDVEKMLRDSGFGLLADQLDSGKITIYEVDSGFDSSNVSSDEPDRIIPDENGRLRIGGHR